MTCTFLEIEPADLLKKAARALSALLPRGLSDEGLKLTGGSVTCPRIRSPEEGAEDVGNGMAEKFLPGLAVSTFVSQG